VPFSFIRVRVAVAAVSIAPGALAAQGCLGGASFADRFARLGAEASFGKSSRAIITGVSVGSRAGPFASVNVGTAHDDRADDNASLFSASAGVAFPVASQGRLQTCPFLSASALNGAKVASGDKVAGYYASEISTRAFALGASIGRQIDLPPGLALVPFGGAAFLTQSTTISDAPYGTAAVTDQGYIVTLGAGLVFGKVVNVRPFTTIATIAGQTTRSSGVHVSIGFGRPSLRRPAANGEGEGEGSRTTVWVNPREGMYYCPGSKWYAASENGSFMTERDAVKSGWQPAIGRRC